MDVDIAIEVQIEFFEDGNQSFNVIVGRLSCSGQRKIALEQDLLFRDVHDDQAVRVRNRRDVVDLHGSRSIRVDLFLVNGLDFRLLRIFRERVGQQRPRVVKALLQELYIVLLRYDCCAFGHECRQTACVIRMTKPNRIILTAAAEDRTSFGCSVENQYTYWDGCLIDSLTQADSWSQLYGTVRRCVETKETQRRFTPSLPRAFFGEAIASLRTPSALPSFQVTADGAGSSRCAVSTDNSYGMSTNNPIKVGLDAGTGPTRELQYLNALRGSAGQSLRFRRVGTTVVENVILDIYELSYEGLPSPVRLYLDGYHFEEPMAPLGFVCPISIGLQP